MKELKEYLKQYTEELTMEEMFGEDWQERHSPDSHNDSYSKGCSDGEIIMARTVLKMLKNIK